jgi:hypothetical protein
MLSTKPRPQQGFPDVERIRQWLFSTSITRYSPPVMAEIRAFFHIIPGHPGR